MSYPDWSTLTDDQRATLLGAVGVQIGTGLELLNFDLSLSRDLSGFLQVDSSGSGGVQWDGSQPMPRQVSLSLACELPWGTALVRVYRTLSDPVSGLAARVDRGVFCLTTPDRALGSSVLVGGVSSPLFAVSGLDRSSLLDRLPGYSVAVLADGSTTVLANVADVYAQAGTPGFLVDSSAALSVQPTSMVWPMVPDSSATTSVDAQTTGGDPLIAANGDRGNSATWRQILNDLHSLVSYRAVWCDGSGLLRSSPYADPAVQAPVIVLDATVPGTMSMDRTVSADLWGVPNRWIFTWSNMPGGSGGTQTPTVANGGVIVLNNVTTGLSSQSARNNLIYPKTFALTAATADDFAAQCAAKQASDLRTVTTYKFALHPSYCVLGHFDVATLVDPAIPGGSDKVQITSWDESFAGDDITVTAVSV